MGITMLQTTIALIIFLFPFAYSPGPGNVFFAANGAQFGFWATLPANIGYHIATLIVTGAIGLGFLSATEKFPYLFSGLQIAGALYVFYNAWRMITAGRVDAPRSIKPATAIDGATLLILNPKAYVIISLMFTQFLGSAGSVGSVGAGWADPILLITTVFTFNNLIAFSVWTLIGARIAAHFETPDTARWLNLFFGLSLAAVAVRMLLP